MAHLRYLWLKRCLKARQADDKAIFPPDWRIAEAISEKFCLETRYADICRTHERPTGRGTGPVSDARARVCVCVHVEIVRIHVCARRDLSVILQHTENLDVKVLLTAIQKTVEFEAAVANRFAALVEIDVRGWRTRTVFHDRVC